MTGRVAVLAAGIGLMWAASVSAQGTNLRALAEIGGGYASFVDDSPIPHGVVQGSARGYITPRLAIGPEFTYMRGPGSDRDWFLTGNLTVDLLPPERPAVLRPYVIAGGGVTHMMTRVGTGPFSSNEGTFTAGAGARIPAARGWYLAPEFRLGWELHWRANVTVGRTF
ncbi:MAG: hypothetical protein ABI634_03115 [Acidobacteriota bacterium]